MPAVLSQLQVPNEMRHSKQSMEVAAAAKVLDVLENHAYRFIFLLQVCMLIATGQAAVGFYLAAFALAGWSSGVVLGIAIAARMAVSHFGGALAPAVLRRLAPRLSFLLCSVGWCSRSP
ncbi:hypothetical protein [Roseixanthobacter liquoris]|uniref:hypothetical protein n=1 Tax=Roseixanthobacter liquoris TaxID=3119921 RepID=UPI003727CA22